MFKISTKEHKPDAQRLKNNIEKLMERGIRVGDLETAFNVFYDKANGLADRIKDETGINNPNSHVQISKYLESTKDSTIYDICYQNDKWTSNADAMEELASRGYTFAELMLKYRKAKKTSEILKSLMDARDKNGLVHPKVTLTKTNRVSLSSPALMGIPKKILWDVVVPFKSGNKIWSADIKNQEPSILFNLLGSKILKEALLSEQGIYEHMFNLCFQPETTCFVFVSPSFENRELTKNELANNKSIPPAYYSPLKTPCLMRYNDEDIVLIDTCAVQCKLGSEPTLPTKVRVYTASGAKDVHVKWDDIPSKKLDKPQIIELKGRLFEVEPICDGIYRKEFKTSWNAMTYGSSRACVRAQCKHINGDMVYDLFHSIKELNDYQKMWKKQAKLGVNCNKTVFGTLMRTDEPITSKLARSLMDLPIQGTGADILDLLVDHFYSERARLGLDSVMDLYFTRNDEPIIEVDGDWQESVGYDYVETILTDIFEHQIDSWVPFKVVVEQVQGNGYADSLDEQDEE